MHKSYRRQILIVPKQMFILKHLGSEQPGTANPPPLPPKQMKITTIYYNWWLMKIYIDEKTINSTFENDNSLNEKLFITFNNKHLINQTMCTTYSAFARFWKHFPYSLYAHKCALYSWTILIFFCK